VKEPVYFALALLFYVRSYEKLKEKSPWNSPLRLWFGANGQFYCFFNLDLSLSAGGQLPDPTRTWRWRESLDSHRTGGWVQPRSVLDGCGKSCLNRESVSGPSKS